MSADPEETQDESGGEEKEWKQHIHRLGQLAQQEYGLAKRIFRLTKLAGRQGTVSLLSGALWILFTVAAAWAADHFSWSVSVRATVVLLAGLFGVFIGTLIYRALPDGSARRLNRTIEELRKECLRFDNEARDALSHLGELPNNSPREARAAWSQRYQEAVERRTGYENRLASLLEPDANEKRSGLEYAVRLRTVQELVKTDTSTEARKRALATLEDVIKDAEGNDAAQAKAYRLSGEICEELDRHADAIFAYSRALEKNPKIGVKKRVVALKKRVNR